MALSCFTKFDRAAGDWPAKHVLQQCMYFLSFRAGALLHTMHTLPAAVQQVSQRAGAFTKFVEHRLQNRVHREQSDVAHGRLEITGASSVVGSKSLSQ